MSSPPPSAPTPVPAPLASTQGAAVTPSSLGGAVARARRYRSGSFDAQDRTPPPRIRIGVCARDKKVKAVAMTKILQRLDRSLFEVVVFGDEAILTQPPDRWPLVDALLAWYSTGFPLDKAIEYVRLRQPFCVNDVSIEAVLRDRRKFYETLTRAGIPTPRHIVVNREGPPEAWSHVVEHDDAIEVDGVVVAKPFVEKPVDAEDHNIYIYYPRRLGGGSKRLFRKVGNVSSKFYPEEHNVRREGSFIYEEFLMTQGTDIKIYCVGPDYAHAEARKSPVVDGIVQRDEEGKEVRFPIMLTATEKETARRVCLAFRQNVCGFDLLRTPGTSYVCDVNGWSFVKKSNKYYDDTAWLLQFMIMRAISPERLTANVLMHTSPPAGLPRAALSPLRTPGSSSGGARSGSGGGSLLGVKGGGAAAENFKGDELRCVAAVIRHGDRTPKQKMKMHVTAPDFLLLHKEFAKEPREEAKLKSATQLQMILEATRKLIAARQLQQQEKQQAAAAAAAAAEDAPAAAPPSTDEDAEYLAKLVQMRSVLEKGGRFCGINRKVQLKPTRWVRVPKSAGSSSSSEALEGAAGGLRSSGGGGSGHGDGGSRAAPTLPPPLPRSSHASSRREASGTQGSSGEESTQEEVCECLLVLKWGGVLTHAGAAQAEVLGQRFRSSLYPGESLGLLRLHSTYRHDLKIYSSDEGRVKMTAAAFAKGFLDLEGELTPILASLVRTVKNTSLLDHFDRAGDGNTMEKLKRRLTRALTQSLHAKGDATAGTSAEDALLVRVSSRRAGRVTAGALAAATSAAAASSIPTAAKSPFPLFSSLRSASGNASNSNLSTLGGEGDGGGEESFLVNPALVDSVAPTRSPALLRALQVLGDPVDALSRIYALVLQLVGHLQAAVAAEARGEALGAETAFLPSSLCEGESLWLVSERWRKLSEDLYSPKTDRYDLSKIPDVYDCIKYEMLHNGLRRHPVCAPLFSLVRAFAEVVVSQEYGIESGQKAAIGTRIAHHLMRKVFFDMTAVTVEETIESELLHQQEREQESRLAEQEVRLRRAASGADGGAAGAAAAAGVAAARECSAAGQQGSSAAPLAAPQPQPPSLLHTLAQGAPPTAAERSSSSCSSFSSSRDASNSEGNTAGPEGSARPSAGAREAAVAAAAAVQQQQRQIDGESESGAAQRAQAEGAAASAPAPQSASGRASAKSPATTELPIPFFRPRHVAAYLPVPVGHSVSSSPGVVSSSIPGLIISIRQRPSLAHTSKVRRKSSPQTLCASLVEEAGRVSGEDASAAGGHLRQQQLPPTLWASRLAEGRGSHLTTTDLHSRFYHFSNLRGGALPSHALVSTAATSSLLRAVGSSSQSSAKAAEGSMLMPGPRLQRMAAAAAAAAVVLEDAGSESAAAGAAPEGSPALASAAAAAAAASSAAGSEDTAAAAAAAAAASAAAEPALSSAPPAGSPAAASATTSQPAQAAPSSHLHASASTSSLAAACPEAFAAPSDAPPSTSASPSAELLALSIPVGFGPESSGDAATAVAASAAGAPLHSSGRRALPPPLSNPSALPTAEAPKERGAMTFLAEDLQSIRETVHQLDRSSLDTTGYGEVKTPQRHVRTRLYFTSESHVHAIVNVLKYYIITEQLSPEGGGKGAKGGEQGGSEAAAAAAAAEAAGEAAGEAAAVGLAPPPLSSQLRQQDAVTGFLGEEARDYLENTPELDYLTHTVFRLYENFSFPMGHARRHRVEIHFSPGACYDPLTCLPRFPRPPPGLASSPSGDGTPRPSSLDGEVRPRGLSLPPSISPLLQQQQQQQAPQAARQGSSPVPLDAGLDDSVASVPDSALPPALAEAGEGKGGSGSGSSRGGSHGGGAGSIEASSTVSTPAGAAAACTAPAGSLPHLEDSHTLPIASLVPLSLSLTLEDFEEVLAEAIYLGGNVGAVAEGGGAGAPHKSEKHPKEEARARTAAAVERIRKQNWNQPGGFFRQEESVTGTGKMN